MLACQEDLHSLSLASVMARAHATCRSPLLRCRNFALLGSPSHCHIATSLALATREEDGQGRAWPGRWTGAAAWGNKDVRIDEGELGCSLDLLNRCHRLAPLQ